VRVLNWNTQIASPRGVNGRFEIIHGLLTGSFSDIICLTEAYAETMPLGGYTTSSGLSGWDKYERLGARKVLLWNPHYPWYDIDKIGSPRLPEGRFVSAKMKWAGLEIVVVGMCIPFHSYRYAESWGEKRKAIWQGAIEYLDALREDVLPQDRYRKYTILLGDFNLQIPPSTYPYPSSLVNRKREQTFADWYIPTAVDFTLYGIDKALVDHIALSLDFDVGALRVINRLSTHIQILSDHNGVLLEVAPHY